MWAVDADPLRPWPRVRKLRNGSYRVKGRYLSALRWLLLLRLLRIATFLLATFLALAALYPYFRGMQGLLGSETVFPWIVDRAEDTQRLWRILLTKKFPEMGSWLRYSGYGAFDFHLLAFAFIVLVLRSTLVFLVASVVTRALWPLFATQLKVTITPQYVIVHRGFRPLRISRGLSLDGGVSFRTIPVEGQRGCAAALLGSPFLNAASSDNNAPSPAAGKQYSSAAVMQGLRSYPIATPRHEADAARIVESCHEALNHTRVL